MNYLQLCQQVMLECGVSGTMTTTVGQAGSLGRVVSWVAAAWNELQCDHDDWDWMRSSNILGGGVSFIPAAAQFTTPLGTGPTQVGVAVDSFGKWDIETFRTFATASGTSNETFLDWVPYDSWRDSYFLGAMRAVQTRPVAFAIGPDQSVNLGPPPNGQYTVTADYFTAPTVMALDTDLPTGLPTRFHMLIVYKAMMKYAGYEAAAEVLQRAAMEWSRMYPQLEALRLPMVMFSGALA